MKNDSYIVLTAIDEFLAKKGVPMEKRMPIMIYVFATITSKSIVPSKPKEFDDYIKRTDNYQMALVTGSTSHNFDRFGWTTQNTADWTAKRQSWEILYLKYSDKTQTTSTVRAHVRAFIKDFQSFSTKFITKIKCCDTVSQDDADEFHFVLVRKPKTMRNAPIAEECFAVVENAGIGLLHMKAKTSSDANRASILPGADGVEVAFKMVFRIGDVETTGIPRVNVDDTYTRMFFSKASLKLAFTNADSGGVVQIFCRWFILGKPQLAGPWSQMNSIRVQ